MNRKYTSEEFLQSCVLLRNYFSHPAITTDVIVGFPGETWEEFEETKAFLKKVHFYEMHVFKYSKREGTRAAKMPDQIPEQVKAARSEQLIALADEMSEEFRSYYQGKEIEVLMEEPFVFEGKKYFLGYTKEYVKAAVETQADIANTFVKGRVYGQINGIYLMG